MAAKLVTADYVVIVVMLLISSGIGVYYWLTGGRQKSTEEYFVANKSMSVLTVAIGLMASYLSAVSLLGVSSEIYVYGSQYAVINISYGIATAFVVYFYLPVFFELDATSAFEYLQKRFGTPTRLLASVAFFLQLLLYTGVVLYAPALALEATTDISRSLSVIGIGLVCTFYSAIGGIKAVLITDVFQSALMIIAVITVIVTSAIDVGGLGRIWEIADEGSRLEFDNISPDPTVRHTWWSVSVGGFFTYLSLYGVNQVQVQRMLTVKNLGAAKRALWWSWPIASIMSLTICFAGLSIYSKYRDCDPLNSGRITSNDQLMPFYVMETLSKYPGVPGLFIAGIFSAGLSTVSATVNSLSAVILEDYIKPLYRYKSKGKEMSSTRSIVASKVLAVVVGSMCLGIAFLAQHLGGLLQAALTIFGVVGGPVLGTFTLGMFTQTGNQKGAITGLILGLAFSFWIGFGQPKAPIPKLPVSTIGCTNNSLSYKNIMKPDTFDKINNKDSIFYLYRLSYMWYCPLGFVSSLLIGWIISWLTKIIFFDKKEEIVIDLRLLTPIIASSIRKRKNTRKTTHV
ncbi:PREDICTED: putative sodium-dependent multivitamin transporter [Polistes canadensis]|uniref:putative sodium-dependent multivitamin transporter n=1 Tax=Polistes canadensis TaxID=91411 RepID=UPI000718D516|nr:PREDICTED: putative sodium-dependent multivitamin transporter [Polistes canadensis]XP_014611125.1 PREDICTED: putative sodium-dependent multivitamin transporter [Polistes canadensis]